MFLTKSYQLKHLVYILFFLTSIKGISQLSPEQERKIDSIKILIQKADHDTVLLNAYKAWDNIIYINDPDLDKELNEKIIILAESNLIRGNLSPGEIIAFKKGLSSGYNALGIVYKYKGDYSKALDYYRKCQKIREEMGDRMAVAVCMNNIANIYKEQGETAKAINYNLQSLKVFEEIDNKKGIATALNNIGNIYNTQREHARAIDYYNRSLKIYEELNDLHGVSSTINNIGNVYQQQGNYDKALEYDFRSLDIRKEIGDKQGIASTLLNIGNIYNSLGNYEKTLDYYKQSHILLEELDDKAGLANLLNNFAIVYQKQGLTEKSIEYSKSALKKANEVGFITIIRDASVNLLECYKKTGKYKEALEMQELYFSMRDSINNEQNQKEILRQELEYNYDKQIALDRKEHEKEIAVSAAQEQKQKAISYSIGVGLVLVLLFTFFVVNRLRITRSQKKIIEHQKELVEEKQKEILDSINYAKRLQEAILPSDQFIKDHLPESFMFYKPKDIVAGDFYWSEQRDNHVFIAAADCTGHGVPGAMVSVVCSNALNRAVLEFGITDPGKILDKTRELVLETFARSDKEVRDGMDISLCRITKNAGTGKSEIEWSGANNPLWYISNEKMIEIKADKQPIGKTEFLKPFTTHSIEINTGDSLFLFTDGFADQFGGPNGKKFKYKPLKEMLLQNNLFSMIKQKEQLEDVFHKWKGELEQVDDVCIIGVRL